MGLNWTVIYVGQGIGLIRLIFNGLIDDLVVINISVQYDGLGTILLEFQENCWNGIKNWAHLLS